jgi:alpha/beta hydrolase family protein
VFQVLTETDMFSIGPSFPPARQPDTRRIRTWEVAGTAHADGRYLRLLYVQGTRELPGMLDSEAFVVANNGSEQYVMEACASSTGRPTALRAHGLSWSGRTRHSTPTWPSPRARMSSMAGWPPVAKIPSLACVVSGSPRSR